MLLLIVASLMMFTFPDREPLIERFSDESCELPHVQDVPFLSRQQSADSGAACDKQWTEPPPSLSLDRRTISALQVFTPCAADTCRPLSAPLKHASARGPPTA